MNVKIKLPLCLVKYRSMGAYGGVKVYFHAFLTLALDGGEWFASRPGSFTLRKDLPVTTGWVGIEAGPDILELREIYCRCRESNPDSSVIQPIA
jgi:hypothetical protein